VKDEIAGDIRDAVADRLHENALEIRHAQMVVMVIRGNVVRALIGMDFVEVRHGSVSPL
jgi:hypothetical protein